MSTPARKCPEGCVGEVIFRPDIVGDTVGGLTLRGWDECQVCGTIFLAPKGMAVVHEAWRISAGGRSVETGNGRIRIDGGSNVVEMVARIAKLPDLELEVATLRRKVEELEGRLQQGPDPKETS